MCHDLIVLRFPKSAVTSNIFPNLLLEDGGKTIHVLSIRRNLTTNFDPMNNLPSVLQREIWEYVRGDRTFWRRKFQQCLDELVGPRDVCHTFDYDDKERSFFQTVNLETFPSNGPVVYGPDRWNNFRVNERGPPWRFELECEFENGSLVLNRASDIILGVIFPEFVPKEVFLHFGGERPIPFRPIGNRLTFPWIPIVALHMTQVRLLVPENKHSFPCQVMHCHVDDWKRDFLADSPSTITFRLGLDKYTVRIRRGLVKVVKNAVIRPVPSRSPFFDWVNSLLAKSSS
jgi:hypothetical protein